MLFYLCISIVLLSSAWVLVYLRKRMVKKHHIIEKFLGNYLFYTLNIFLGILVMSGINYFIMPVSLKVMTETLGIFLLILGTIGYKNFSKSQIVREKIVLDKKSHLEKLRIGFISDVHLSAATSKKVLEKSLKKLKQENPDVVLIGGDLIDVSHRDIRKDFTNSFRILNPRYGAFAVLGNHEYQGGAEENMEYIKSLGINVLRDEVISIGGISIIGRDDVHNLERMSLENLAGDLKGAKIVVDHNPVSLDESLESDIDLQLSGHTHRGQIFPFNLVVRKIYKNFHGYKIFNERLHSIVSSGMGSWLIPYRIRSRSEINIIDLHFKSV